MDGSGGMCSGCFGVLTEISKVVTQTHPKCRNHIAFVPDCSLYAAMSYQVTEWHLSVQLGE